MTDDDTVRWTWIQCTECGKWFYGPETKSASDLCECSQTLPDDKEGATCACEENETH